MNFSSLALGSLAALILAVGAGCGPTVIGSGTNEGGGGGAGGADGTGGSGGTVQEGKPCTPGQIDDCSTMSCQAVGSTGTGSAQPAYGGVLHCQQFPDGTWHFPGYCMCPSTPLVLSFDGAPVEYLVDSTHGFDLGAAASVSTDWPTAKTPWLALDRDGNGRIDDGGELFGSMTLLPGGSRAPNGFVALRALDADGDGRITAADPGFAHLLVWSDRDGDRRSASSELSLVTALELVSIDLDYTIDPRCDARGNCEVERASFRYRDAAGALRTGTVIDIHLPAQR